jgi:hypothetical protein
MSFLSSLNLVITCHAALPNQKSSKEQRDAKWLSEICVGQNSSLLANVDHVNAGFRGWQCR